MNDKIDSANRKLQTDLFSVSTESWIKLKESLEAPKNAEYLEAQTYYDSTQTKIWVILTSAIYLFHLAPLFV